MLGGAIGNLIDRIFRSPGFLQGHVVDFVSVFGPNAEYFPVFNVADSAITIGGISLVITALLGIDFDGTRTRKPTQGRQGRQCLTSGGCPVPDGLAGMRVDAGLAKLLGLSRTTVATMIDSGDGAGRRQPRSRGRPSWSRTAGWRSPCRSRSGRRWWCRRPSRA